MPPPTPRGAKTPLKQVLLLPGEQAKALINRLAQEDRNRILPGLHNNHHSEPPVLHPERNEARDPPDIATADLHPETRDVHSFRGGHINIPQLPKAAHSYADLGGVPA